MNHVKGHDPDLRWRDILQSKWLKLFHLLGTIVSISVISILSVRDMPTEQPQSDTLRSESQATKREVEADIEWLIPEPLPFPPMTALADGVKKRFKIPAAEFQLAIERPRSWEMLELSEEIVRFQEQGKSEEYVSFAAGCFGDCDRMSENIADSLAAHVERDHHRGLDPRVVHWYVHSKHWVEYSVLYRESDGRAWMTGASIRWSPEWLNALKCTYRAPVQFPYESERVLHLAWDIWAVEFIRYCRQYEVLSWE